MQLKSFIARVTRGGARYKVLGVVLNDGTPLKSVEVFQISRMSCHDDKPIAALKRDRAGWTREVEKMMNWGAYVPANRKEEHIEYLTTAFSHS
jgi:hypothetical protein